MNKKSMEKIKGVAENSVEGLFSRIIKGLINQLASLIGFQLFDPDSREEKILVPKEKSKIKLSIGPVRQTKLEIVKQMLPTSNKTSRPGYAMIEVRGIVVHWPADPGATAKGIRDYFAKKTDCFASTHFVLDDKVIIQMIPENEIGFSVGAEKYMKGIVEKFMTPFNAKSPNYTTLSIEACHIDWTGRMADKTIINLENLCAHLLKRFSLSIDDLYTHNDITGKNCPKYFVDNPKEWAMFKRRVNLLIGE